MLTQKINKIMGWQPKHPGFIVVMPELFSSQCPIKNRTKLFLWTGCIFTGN
jgi:hypothetical protein